MYQWAGPAAGSGVSGAGGGCTPQTAGRSWSRFPLQNLWRQRQREDRTAASGAPDGPADTPVTVTGDLYR